MEKVSISEHKDMAMCGDGCCHADGLFIDVGDNDFDYFFESELEKERVIRLLEQVYKDREIQITLLSK